MENADETRFIRSLKLQNFLSFGPDTDEFPLGSLNVLVGANASGKSNLLEAIALLGSLESDLSKFIRQGGGISQWPYKGSANNPTARIEATLNYPQHRIEHDGERMPLRYYLEFAESGQRLELVDEALENAYTLKDGKNDVFFFYRYQRGKPVLSVAGDGQSQNRRKRQLKREELDPEESVFSQRKDPDQYPEVTWVGEQFSAMRLYRNWTFGRHSPPREAQQTDLPNDLVEEDARNLGLVLNSLLGKPRLKKKLLNHLTDLYQDIEDIHTKIHAGTVQIFVHERGLRGAIPATRLSDGTLRYLFLLTVLLHPDPPPVICLEEPELGLHPRTLPRVAGLMKKASERTQLIVTTHSSYFLSQFDLEDIVVTTHSKGGTELLRPADSKALVANLEDFGAEHLQQMHRTDELEFFASMNAKDEDKGGQ